MEELRDPELNTEGLTLEKIAKALTPSGQFMGGYAMLPQALGALLQQGSSAAKNIMDASGKRLAGGDYNPKPAVDAARSVGELVYGGRLAGPIARLLAKAPKTVAATAGVMGPLATTSEAGDITPESVGGYPPRPERSAYGIMAVPELPKEELAKGQKYRQNRLEELKGKVSAGDEAYNRAMQAWQAQVKDVDRLIQEKTRTMANRPLRESHETAFLISQVLPLLLSGAKGFKAQRGLSKEFKAMAGRREGLRELKTLRATQGKPLNKAAREELAALEQQGGEAPTPWKTIAGSGVGAAPVTQLPSMIDYTRLEQGQRGSELAKENIKDPYLWTAGAGKGALSAYIGSLLGSLVK